MTNSNDNQETDSAGGPVRDALRALPKVDAPADFMFRVKARIAEGNAPADARRGGFRWMPLAASAALVLTLVAGLVFVVIRASRADEQLAVVSPVPETTRAAEKSFSAENAAPEPASPSNEAAAAPSPAPTSPSANAALVPAASPVRATPVRGPVAGSDDIAPAATAGDGSAERESRDFSSSAETPRLPEGFEGSSRTSQAPAPVAAPQLPTTAFPVREILSQAGIDAAFDGRRWVVRSVRAESVGDASGVLASDVVEAIDEYALRGETITATALTVRELTVVRDGKRLVLKLRSRR